MEREGLDRVDIPVPIGEGYLIGDILRKYALRSVGSWQVVGYKLDTTSVNFGMSNGAMSSYLRLLQGKLVCVGAQPEDNGPRIVSFKWNGNCFACEGFELHGLDRSVGTQLTACISYGKGHHTADKNREIVLQVTNCNSDGYFIVPSSHSPVTTFRYQVSPVDDKQELLRVEADSGAVRRAQAAAVKTLSGFSI